jgi:hypothetical protein
MEIIVPNLGAWACESTNHPSFHPNRFVALLQDRPHDPLGSLQIQGRHMLMEPTLMTSGAEGS